MTPFVAGLAHGESGSRRAYALEEPLTTVHAGGNNHALVSPFVAYAQQGGAVRDVDGPMHTVTASAKDCNTVVAPHLIRVDQTSGDPARKGVHDVQAPVNTLTTGGGFAVAAPYLVPRYGEREGQEPRTRSVEAPMPVVVPTANGGSLAAVHLSRQFGASVGSDAGEPVGTVTAGGGGKTAIVAAHLSTMRNSDKPFQGADEPAHTVTAGGARAGVVAAFLAQHNTGLVGHAPAEPVSTIVGKGCTQAVIEASLLSHMYTSNTAGGQGDPAEPLKTVTAGGFHAAEVRAFLVKYYGEGSVDQPAGDPLHTVPTRDRFGLVTTTINGEPYAIVDIGMRMLSPRELFRAQGFPDSYVIDRGVAPDGKTVTLTKTAQVRMCGNSVWPAARSRSRGGELSPPTRCRSLAHRLRARRLRRCSTRWRHEPRISFLDSRGPPLAPHRGMRRGRPGGRQGGPL